jgi:transcriptional regulator with XRE-family HTH domain
MLATMDVTELRLVMVKLECRTQAALATKIGVKASTVGLWLRGRIGVPRPVAMLLRLLAQ